MPSIEDLEKKLRETIDHPSLPGDLKKRLQEEILARVKILTDIEIANLAEFKPENNEELQKEISKFIQYIDPSNSDTWSINKFFTAYRQIRYKFIDALTEDSKKIIVDETEYSLTQAESEQTAVTAVIAMQELLDYITLKINQNQASAEGHTPAPATKVFNSSTFRSGQALRASGSESHQFEISRKRAKANTHESSRETNDWVVKEMTETIAGDISAKQLATREVVAQEFFRLMLPWQPKTRVAVADVASAGNVYVMSKKIEHHENFNQHLKSSEAFYKSCARGDEIKGLGGVVVCALYLNEIDLKFGNMIVDKNGYLIKFDGDWCFGRLQSGQDQDAIDYTISPEDLRSLPHVDSSYVFNWLGQYSDERLNRLTPNMDNSLFEIRNSTAFFREIHRSMLKILTMPDKKIDEFVHHYVAEGGSVNANEQALMINELKLRRNQLQIASQKMQSFQEYLKSPARLEDWEAIKSEHLAFHLTGKVKFMTHNEIELFENQMQTLTSKPAPPPRRARTGAFAPVQIPGQIGILQVIEEFKSKVELAMSSHEGGDAYISLADLQNTLSFLREEAEKLPHINQEATNELIELASRFTNSNLYNFDEESQNLFQTNIIDCVVSLRAKLRQAASIEEAKQIPNKIAARPVSVQLFSPGFQAAAAAGARQKTSQQEPRRELFHEFLLRYQGAMKELSALVNDLIDYYTTHPNVNIADVGFSSMDAIMDMDSKFKLLLTHASNTHQGVDAVFPEFQSCYDNLLSTISQESKELDGIKALVNQKLASPFNFEGTVQPFKVTLDALFTQGKEYVDTHVQADHPTPSKP